MDLQLPSLVSSSSSLKPCPTILESATWILFIHYNLSWAKTSDKLYFFRSIFTTAIHVHFALTLSLDHGPSTSIAKTFFTRAVVVGLHWTCSNHLIKWIFLILFLVNAIPKYSKKRSFLVLPYIHLNILISINPFCADVASWLANILHHRL